MTDITTATQFHGMVDAALVSKQLNQVGAPSQFSYDFQNFFHPLVGELIKQLNLGSVAGMLDPAFLSKPEMNQAASWFWQDYGRGPDSGGVVTWPKNVDVALGGPYANYNWELVYHIPVMIAVHLSNNQRFAEAQKWFHLVFDPTSTDTSVLPPMCYWKSWAFRNNSGTLDISALLELLSTPNSQLVGDPAAQAAKQGILTAYRTMLQDPFQPHAIARTRLSAYQWYVVMKYLDNLIAWGDSLFLQNTVETLNEATLCYVLAANLLGPRPQQIPPHTAGVAKNFLQLKQGGLDVMGNALVELESQFPFNDVQGSGSTAGNDLSGALFGIGRSLYFCLPHNQKLMGYWDIVADRLFKIRNSENIQGVFQKLPLFDAPLDPGMLVKAAAAGLDIGSIVSGTNQPIGPVRCLLLIQKAAELAAEVRSLGNSLLAALEKGDAEQLALLRQGHEVTLQGMVQDSRFLQWKHAKETTNGLLKTRDSAIERYTYYLRLLGQTPDSTTVPATLNLDRSELNEKTFDQTYSALVSQYSQTVAVQSFPDLPLAQSASPSNQSGATGQGQLYLTTQEHSELDTHLPTARDTGMAASVVHAGAGVMTYIPEVGVDFHFWGLGGRLLIFGGSKVADSMKIGAEILQTISAYHQAQAGMSSRTAGYQRRVDEWTLQANLAARDLMQIGEQILASLIAEQVAHHDYLTVQTQVQQALDVQTTIQTKFTNATFYSWMQSEVYGLYYQFYRFACDIARRAEQTMKRELMRPELDSTQFIQFNYWDSGHQGLLSGEALSFDIKRMEMAYHDNNKREFELTRHISLRQLDPMALLALRITGSCTVNIPEWLFDRDCPGHYLRRLKAVSASTPAVAASFTSVNCTLTLQQSSIRVSPLLSGGVYARDTTQADARFIDYFGGVESIVTSSGTNDSGMFETNLKEERFLPFEGAGVIGSWTVSLPPDPRSFDYLTISDFILHVRYTARQAGGPLASQATAELRTMLDTAGQSSQALLFCLRYDFPTEWSAFVNSASGAPVCSVVLQKSYFPYAAQSAKQITIDAISLYAAVNGQVTPAPALALDLGMLSANLNTAGSCNLSLPADNSVMTQVLGQQVFLIVQYHFGNA